MQSCKLYTTFFALHARSGVKTPTQREEGVKFTSMVEAFLVYTTMKSDFNQICFSREAFFYGQMLAILAMTLKALLFVIIVHPTAYYGGRF